MVTCENCQFWNGDVCTILLAYAVREGLACVPLSLESTVVAGCKWYRGREVVQ